MSSRTQLIAALALFALGFGAGAWWMDARRAPEIAELEAAAAKSMVADLAQLSGAVPGPQLPASRQKATTVAGVRNASAPASPPKDAGAARPETAGPLEGVPPEIAELIGRLTAMDSDFAAQKRDDAWAAKQDRFLRDLLRNSPTLLPPGVELMEIDCRTTLCQVRFSGAPKDLRSMNEDPMRAFAETLSAQRYSVHWTIVGRPDAATDEYVYTLRPEALFAQPSPGQP